GAGIEDMLLPEVRGVMAIARHIAVFRKGLAQHPAVVGEGGAVQRLDRQPWIFLHDQRVHGDGMINAGVGNNNGSCRCDSSNSLILSRTRSPRGSMMMRRAWARRSLSIRFSRSPL